MSKILKNKTFILSRHIMFILYLLHYINKNFHIWHKRGNFSRLAQVFGSLGTVGQLNVQGGEGEALGVLATNPTKKIQFKSKTFLDVRSQIYIKQTSVDLVLLSRLLTCFVGGEILRRFCQHQN